MSTPLAVDFGQGLTDAWSNVVAFAPLLLGFLAILIVGWLISKLIGMLVGKGLHRLGLDRALHRGGLGDYMDRSRYGPSELLGKIVYYTLVLVTLTLAFNVFGPTNPISQLLNQVIAWIPNLIVALVIVVVAALIARMVRDVVSGALGGLGYGRLLANIAGVFIVALGVVAALNQIGVAEVVTQSVLIAVLATVGGILVVGLGGGMVRPMQQRWARWLDTAEREARGKAARESAEAGESEEAGPAEEAASYERGRGDAMRPESAEEAGQETPAASRPGRGRPGGTGEER